MAHKPIPIDFPDGGFDHLGSRTQARRLLIGLIFLNLLAVGVCAALLTQSRRADLENAAIEAQNDVRLAEKAADAIFDKAALALGAVVLQLEQQLARGGLEPATLWPMVDAQVALVREVDRIGVFDSQGKQVCGLAIERCQHLVVKDRDYFQRLREHPGDPVKLYGPMPSRADGQPVMMLARSIRQADGAFAGVAIALVPMEKLRPLVASAKLGPGGSASLRTVDFVSLLREPKYTGPNNDAASRAVSDVLRSAVAISPIEGTYTTVAPADGVERLAVYRRLEHYPLYWFEGRAIDHILADWRSRAAWTAAFLALFAGVSVLLARTTMASLQRQSLALQLYDEAPCGYHMLDPDGTYLSINATELDWLGCKREDVIGKLKPTDFFTEAGRETFATNFPKLASTEKLEGLDLEVVSRNGTVRRVLVSASAVRDAQGRFLHSSSVMHDISDLHEARTQLRALAQQQGVMLNNDMIGIVRLKNRRTVWKNQAMDRIFGYTGAEWDGLPSRVLYFDDATHARMGAELQAAIQQGQTYRVQLPMRHKDGRAVWIDASGALLSASSGEVMMMLADITPLKAAEEVRLNAATLEAQNFQLRETNRLKSEFVANMSHELRTPLNAILGFGQMLEAGSVKPDSPKFPTYIKRIVESGKHLLGLIEQVLDVGRIEAGRMAFEPEPVNVPQILHKVVELKSAESAARHVTVRVDVDDGVESVDADPLRLQQMLLSLVDNAIKFSHEGGSVALHASGVDAAFWQVSVTDQGVGIAEADIPRLFAPFLQLSSGTAKVHGGTGVGLALVKMMANAQGGNVGVRSQLGQGSTFLLILPRSGRDLAGGGGGDLRSDVGTPGKH